MSVGIVEDKDLGRGKMGRIRVLAVTGSSGGHIYPAVSFLVRLKDTCHEAETLLVLPKRNAKNKIVEPATSSIKYISIPQVTSGFGLRSFLWIFKFIKGTFESLFLLLEFKPDAVVGFGCIDSVPLLFFAWLFRIKTLIHEQNVIPGKANRLLAIFSDKIALSFPESRIYLKDFERKTVITGNPVRQELGKIDKKEALNFFGFSDNKFTILVVGGSLGSHRINEVFFEAATLFPNKADLQIIHLTGIKDYESLNKSYKNLEIDSKILDFFRAMHYAYSASDLVISRAGATTITEIMFFNLPAILIPYPYAYKHQLSNARILEQKGCAIIIEEEELSKEILIETIGSFLKDPGKLQNMRSGYSKAPYNNASDLLVKELLSLDN